MRLICIPPAGGCGRLFNSWRIPGIEVVKVTLPGRGSRWSEPTLDSMAAVMDFILRAYRKELVCPVALLGHSFGALVAYELAIILERFGDGPCHLFVSCCRAPHYPATTPWRHALPDAELKQELLRFGGTDHRVIDEHDLMELFLPALRSDLKIAETYTASAERRVTCPITLGCRARYLRTRDSIQAWQQHGSGRFRVVCSAADTCYCDRSYSLFGFAFHRVNGSGAGIDWGDQFTKLKWQFASAVFVSATPAKADAKP